MRLYTDPAYNKVAPNARAQAPGFDARWERIAAIGKPYPHANWEQRATFEYWFNYFWHEAVERGQLAPAARPGARTPRVATKLEPLHPAEKVALVAVFDTLFVLTDAAPGWAPRVPAPALDDHGRFMLLRQLLLLGFQRVSIGPSGAVRHHGRQFGDAAVARPMLVPGSVAPDALQVVTTVRTTAADAPLRLVFRCDDRTFEEIKAAKGFHSRARQPGTSVAAEYGLTQPWHPYAQPIYRDSLWLRLGSASADNCLHTVVSVGTRLAMITHFPILSDAANVFPVCKEGTSTPLSQVSLDEWSPADVQRARSFRRGLDDGQFLRPVHGPDGKLDHIEKRARIYAMVLPPETRGFNTEAFFVEKGDAFPERAVDKVPDSAIVAMMEVVRRYWFDAATGKLDIYDIEFARTEYLMPDSTMHAVFGLDTTVRLKSVLQAEQRAALARYAPEKAKRDAWIAAAATRLTKADVDWLLAVMPGVKQVVPKPARADETRELVARLGPGRPPGVPAPPPTLTEAKIRAIGVESWSRLRKFTPFQ